MKRNRVPASVWRNPVHFLACGFGSGAVPLAPGTAGTLIAVPVYLVLAPLPVYVYLAVTTLFLLVGIELCEQTAKDFGVHDHGGIVWDEIVGYLITMIAAPRGWVWIAVGFLLFRIFDILKPWPIRVLDRNVHGGLGIMLDDVLAGVYAAVSLSVVARLAA